MGCVLVHPTSPPHLLLQQNEGRVPSDTGELRMCRWIADETYGSRRETALQTARDSAVTCTYGYP